MRPNTWLHRPSLRREDSPCQLGAVHTWPEASFRCLAPIRPKSRVKPTCRDSSTDAIDPCRKWSVQRSRGNNDDQYAAGDGSLNRCRAGAQPNRPISGHRYTRGSAAWRCPNSVVFCPNFPLAAFIRVARFSFPPCRWSRAGPGTRSETD